jgi:hypothetical protein
MPRSRRENAHECKSLDVRTVAALPDKLAAITLDLRRLCYKEASRIGPQAVVTIGACCDRLHIAVEEVIKLVEFIEGQPKLRKSAHGEASLPKTQERQPIANS